MNSNARYIIADNRPDGLWTWNGDSMRPIARHESKSYTSRKMAERYGAELYRKGCIVFELRIVEVECF
jgi:hypothetical protein